MSFTFNLSDPQLNPLTLAAIANPSRIPTRRADPPLRSPLSHSSLKSATLSPMSSGLFHRKDRHREREKDIRGTTDHLIDARQKKHVEDAFISSQLVQLGLLDPRHAIGKQAARNRVDEIVNGTGRGEEYPKKNSSISHGTAVAPPHTSSHDPRPPSNQSNKKSTKSSGKSHRSKNSIGSTSLKSRAGGGESGMLDAQRRGTRRERTFVGTECAVCEEPLEHTLRGERILQFSCGHVSHGACFYEFLKMGGRAQGGEGEVCPSCERPLGLDTSRGGNVLDIEKITDMVRSASVKDREQATPTPSNWDSTNSSHATVRPSSKESRAAREPARDYDREGMVSRQGGRDGRESAAGYGGERRDDRRDTRDTHQTRDTRHTNYSADARAMGRESHQTQQTQHTHNLSQHTNISQDRYQQEKALPQGHRRNDSEATGQHTTSSGGYQESQRIVVGHAAHPYDVAAMESDVLSPRSSVVKNPIPAPVVTVRAEFPTVERSRVQQTLTCLVTIEVPGNGWRADPVDLHLVIPALPEIREEERYARPPSPVKSIPPPPPTTAPRFYPYESAEVLEEMTESLRSRVENWHGLEFSRFGKLRLYGTIRVGKDKLQWQELECYLFAEMLICVKEKKGSSSYSADGRTKCTLKGSILIKKHLEGVTQTSARDEIGLTQRITSSNLRAGEENILTLSLSVKELPQFHLQFENLNQLKLWQQALLDLHAVEGSPAGQRIQRNNGYDTDGREGELSEDDDWRRSHGTGPSSHKKRTSSLNSSAYAGRSSHTTANTDYSNNHRSMDRPQIQQALHVPVDIVLVVPISSSMQGVKMSLVRDALSYLVHALGPQDRMGLVTFGSSGGGVPLVGMTTKSWSGWGDILRNVRPVGQKLHRADVVDGANVAMDLLMQRKTSNPIATILLISDASTAENEPVDFVVSRAEAAKIAIHSFGLGLTHQPTTLLDLSSRTKGAYTYVKDWMMLRECLAGCLGALQSMSHQNAKLKLRLPEGSVAKFGKVSGATSVVKRASGRDVEASIGDLVWGGRRDILVQLIIAPDAATPALASAGENDPWDSIMSSLDALAGPLDEDKSPRPVSIEEVPLIQADLSWGDLLRENTQTHLPRPTLLAITMLPPSSNNNTSTAPGRKGSVFNSEPVIPPHPSVVQRRMELLTSDMLSRALMLVGRGQQERAAHLLTETRSILKGLGKGGVLGGVGAPPPVPAIPLGGLPPLPPTPATPLTPHTPGGGGFYRRSPNYGNGYGHGHLLDGDSRSSSRERDRSKRSRDPSPANLSPATYTPGSAGFDVHTAPLPPPPGPPPSLPPPGMEDRPKTGNGGGVVPYPGGLVIDQATVAALDQELEAALEWIHHPAVFSRDSRKAVLQAVGVVQDQRAWTTRTALEKLVAERVGGVVKALESAATWGREQDEDGGFGSARPGGLEGVREES